MPPRTARAATTAPPPPPDTAEPPWYEATEDLYVGDPEAGAMPQLAYRKGDRVAPDVIEPNGWAGKVAVPELFAGQLPEVPAPEATAPASDAAGPAPGKEE